MTFLLNGKPVDALALIVHRSAQDTIGRQWVKKLREHYASCINNSLFQHSLYPKRPGYSSTIVWSTHPGCNWQKSYCSGDTESYASGCHCRSLRRWGLRNLHSLISLLKNYLIQDIMNGRWNILKIRKRVNAEWSEWVPLISLKKHSLISWATSELW